MLYRAHERINKTYDVIIIGAGLAGMTAANTLAKSGFQVLLLEAHNKLGGFATWFYRDARKHVFDISLHGFPVGMIKTCRRYWSSSIADCIVQLKDIRFHNPQFSLQTEFTRSDFIAKLVDVFGQSQEQAHAFFDFLSKMNFYDQNAMTNRELFEKFFPARNDIVRFLMEPITYANGSTLDDPAVSYGIVFSNFMSKGVYTFQGGTDQLIDKMKAELLNNGVDIKLQSKVTRILFDNGRASGVETKDGVLSARCVLSNANIQTTVMKLAGREHFSEHFCESVQKVRLNTSSCQVYMGFKAGVQLPDLGDLVFTSTHPEYDSERLLDLKVSSRTFSVYDPRKTRPHETEARASIVSSTNCRYQHWSSLDELSYEKEKAQMIEETLQALERFYPHLRDDLEFVEAATPLTVERFTHHPQGSSFGTKFEGLEASMNLHKEVPGLFHAGSVGIIMSGWLGAANYGVIQANEIARYLSKENS